MNAGAYGGEIAEAVAVVEGLDGAGERVRFDRETLAFRYRRAELPSGFLVTAVRFRLTARRRGGGGGRAWTPCADGDSRASRRDGRIPDRCSRTPGVTMRGG